MIWCATKLLRQWRKFRKVFGALAMSKRGIRRRQWKNGSLFWHAVVPIEAIHKHN